jgi:hypothetical protein
MTKVLTKPEIVDEPPKDALEVAAVLHATVGKLITALPGQPQRPMDLARKVNADKSVAHRLVTALSKAPNIGTLITLPGPVPLGEIVQAAKRLGVDPALCADSLDAIARFDGLIQSLAGDRATFDAMMSEWADEARGPIDTAARQMIYRGMKHVQGVAAETGYTAFVQHPSATSAIRGDCIALECLLGLHRVRSGGNLVIRRTSDLMNAAVVADSTRCLLDEFCSKPVPTFRTSGPAAGVTCELDWNGRLGRLQTCDVVVGEVHRNVLIRCRTSPEREFTGVSCCPWVPVRRAIFDVLFHKDIYPMCIPTFAFSRTGAHGTPDLNDQSRLPDRIRVDCSTEAFGIGTIARMATPEVPFQRRLLETQIAALNWDIREFRAFRVRVDYPIFDTDMMCIIPLPETAT